MQFMKRNFIFCDSLETLQEVLNKGSRTTCLTQIIFIYISQSTDPNNAHIMIVLVLTYDVEVVTCLLATDPP